MVKDPKSLMDQIFEKGHQFNFFQLVYLFEQLFESDKPMNKTWDAGIRFHANPGLGFPGSDIYQVRKNSNNPAQLECILNFMGLYGVSSPLPQYFYTEIAKSSEKSEPVRDFLDIFNHRLYQIFYRSWKKYRGYLNYQQGGRDDHSQRLMSLAGLGTRNATLPLKIVPVRIISFIGRLSSRARNKEGLCSMLTEFFDAIHFEIQEFIPRWVAISNRVQLGSKTETTKPILGQNIVVGEKILDFNGKFRIRIGPLSIDQFYNFLPGGEFSTILHQFVRMYVRDWLYYDLLLLLRSAEIPELILGGVHTQLGWNTWLGKPKEDIVSIHVEVPE